MLEAYKGSDCVKNHTGISRTLYAGRDEIAHCHPASGYGPHTVIRAADSLEDLDAPACTWLFLRSPTERSS
ncbi:hypothetical protein J3F83DRAFT_751070 [Trichoderma novae-zelandiae]